MITFSEQPSACLDVLTNPANVLSHDARREDLDVAGSTIGVLVRDDGVSIEWHRRARHDLHCGSRGQPVQRRLARGNLADNRKTQRRMLRRLSHILGAYGVAVHGRIVESWEVDGGNDVLTDVEAYCIQDVLTE